MTESKTVLFLCAFILSIFTRCGQKSTGENSTNIAPIHFNYTNITGIGHEPGCTRRDPSDVILVENTYYVYYTKVYGTSPGYWGTVWCASSRDKGYSWNEEGEVLGKGDHGAFDSQATFTPNIIRANNKYYLFYTGVKPTPDRIDGKFENNSTTDITAIGLAMAESPIGPFTRIYKNPVLEVSGQKENFDSYRVDDSSLLFRDDKYWLYYKGRSRKHGTEGPSQTQMGVAFSKNIEGPYTKYSTPILPESHEVLIWPYKGGVMTLASKSSTLEFAPDGIDFLSDKKAIKVTDRPNAPGALRPELTQLSPNENGIRWGISMVHNGDEAYLIRFDCKTE